VLSGLRKWLILIGLYRCAVSLLVQSKTIKRDIEKNPTEDSLLEHYLLPITFMAAVFITLLAPKSK
jgi:hypothetical protein